MPNDIEQVPTCQTCHHNVVVSGPLTVSKDKSKPSIIEAYIGKDAHNNDALFLAKH